MIVSRFQRFMIAMTLNVIGGLICLQDFTYNDPKLWSTFKIGLLVASLGCVTNCLKVYD